MHENSEFKIRTLKGPQKIASRTAHLLLFNDKRHIYIVSKSLCKFRYTYSVFYFSGANDIFEENDEVKIFLGIKKCFSIVLRFLECFMLYDLALFLRKFLPTSFYFIYLFLFLGEAIYKISASLPPQRYL